MLRVSLIHHLHPSVAILFNGNTFGNQLFPLIRFFSIPDRSQANGERRLDGVALSIKDSLNHPSQQLLEFKVDSRKSFGGHGPELVKIMTDALESDWRKAADASWDPEFARLIMATQSSNKLTPARPTAPLAHRPSQRGYQGLDLNSHAR
jgi:hypothetical protein